MDMATRMYWNGVSMQNVRSFVKIHALKKEQMLPDATDYADRSGLDLPEKFQ